MSGSKMTHKVRVTTFLLVTTIPCKSLQVQYWLDERTGINDLIRLYRLQFGGFVYHFLTCWQWTIWMFLSEVTFQPARSNGILVL
jgi:hypothetical protein